MSESILSRPEIIWFIIGLVLFLLELVIPGFVIFFFGVGAWITAIICLFAAPGINLQIIVFALTSILSLIALRRIVKKKVFFNRENQSIDIDDEFTGKEAVAISPIRPLKKGKVEFKGTTWDAESTSEVNDGQTVIIVEKENFTLIVEPKK